MLDNLPATKKLASGLNPLLSIREFSYSLPVEGVVPMEVPVEGIALLALYRDIFDIAASAQRDSMLG